MKTKRILSLLLVCAMLAVPIFTLSSGAASVSTRPSIVGVHVRVESGFTAYFYIEAPSPQTTEVGIFVGEERIKANRMEDGRYVAALRGISPTKMSDLFAVYPYAVIGTSSNVRGEAYLFGLQDYAMRLLAQEELAEPTRRMLIAMLNFGAACQIKEDYRTHLLANVGLTEEERTLPTRPLVNVFEVPSFEADELAYSASASAYYKNSLLFSFGFRVDGLEDATGTYMEIADNPEFLKSVLYSLTQSKTKDEEGNTVYVYSTDTDGIYLNCLDKPYYVRLVTPDGVSRAITYSVESYAYLVLETEAGEEIEQPAKDFLRALIAFGDALRAYDEAAATPEQ